MPRVSRTENEHAFKKVPWHREAATSSERTYKPGNAVRDHVGHQIDWKENAPQPWRLDLGTRLITTIRKVAHSVSVILHCYSVAHHLPNFITRRDIAVDRIPPDFDARGYEE